MNALLSSDEGRNNYSMPDHTKKVSLVTSENRFVCHTEGIMNSRYQGRKLGLDISRVSIDYNSNIIGHHNNMLIPDEGSNKVSKPDLDTASKPNLDITQCAKYLFNDPLNLNLSTPSSNFACKYYVTHTTLPKDSNQSQPGNISHKEGNRPENSHLTLLHEYHCSDKH